MKTFQLRKQKKIERGKDNLKNKKNKMEDDWALF